MASKIVIGGLTPATMSLYDLSVYTTDFSWRNVLTAAKNEIVNAETMLHKAQCMAMETQLPQGTWLYYPLRHNVFRSLYYTPFDQVKVVIIAMDPYPGRNDDGTPQANGIAFSCNGNTIPASLRNIFNEVKRSIPSFVIPSSGDLRAWCKQGVLLLNGAMTHLQGCEHRYQKMQSVLWEPVVSKILEEVTKKNKGLSICMWGRDAQSYDRYIKGSHQILVASHPSPNSFASGDSPFRGCDHFSLINKHLEKQGRKEVDWSLV